MGPDPRRDSGGASGGSKGETREGRDEGRPYGSGAKEEKGTGDGESTRRDHIIDRAIKYYQPRKCIKDHVSPLSTEFIARFLM